MEGQLKRDIKLVSENGITYTVLEFLGAGGQGEVYKVDSDKGQFALKWYFPNMATKAQRDIINNLIASGRPNNNFLWPIDIVSQGKVFGYIMDLRPVEYKSIMDMMKRKAEPTFYNLCKAAFNLTKSYQALHAKGYCYRDISFGNVFLNPNNGSVLICDNDNVAINGEDSVSVYGTPRFMAPEIVIGQAKPSRNTDLYSLSVLLFYMFMLNHPLEGKREANIKCLDVPAMNQIYGTNPIFIFDPLDKSNRPLIGYHDNALIFWDLYPKKLKDLFTIAFTDGLKFPQKRVTENQWCDIFIQMLGEIMICSHCGSEIFLDANKEKLNVLHSCWNCQKPISVPGYIKINKNRILIYPNTKIYSHHISDDYDMETVVGEIVNHPINPKVWGIKNKTNKNWTYKKVNGEQLIVEPDKSASISSGAIIGFGQVNGEILKGE